jgi:hypothetical protein
MTDSSKHSSLLRISNNYDCRKFYDIGTQGLHYKSFYNLKKIESYSVGHRQAGSLPLEGGSVRSSTVLFLANIRLR